MTSKMSDEKGREVRKGEIRLKKMPTDEVTFTEELILYKKGSGETSQGSASALDPVTLRSVEWSNSTMARDSSFSASDTEETNSTILVWWRSTVSQTNRATHPKSFMRPKGKPYSTRRCKNTKALRYASKCSQETHEDSGGASLRLS